MLFEKYTLLQKFTLKKINDTKMKNSSYEKK